MTIGEILAEGKKLLSAPEGKTHIDTPYLDAALLLSKVLNIGREWLILKSNENISTLNREKYLCFLERRLAGECVAYITGYREFHNLLFTVDPNVLVPRPETETLIEAALEYIDSWNDARTQRIKNKQETYSLQLLDLCTGSGAAAISLKKERPFLSVTASDISKEALETAGKNAKNLLDKESDDHHKDNTILNIRFIHSDLFKKITGKFNIIISNPPYIPTEEIDDLLPEVKKEPLLALDGGRGGLEIIKKIISSAPGYMFSGGILLLESDPRQMSSVNDLLLNRGFINIKIYKDLATHNRVISGIYKN